MDFSLESSRMAPLACVCEVESVDISTGNSKDCLLLVVAVTVSPSPTSGQGRMKGEGS